MIAGEMHTGTNMDYRWISIERADYVMFDSFIQSVNESVLNKVVAITSFDSGPLTPNDEEVNMGWRRIGDILWTTSIINISSLPYDNYDEWYIFESYPENQIEKIRTFVNYGCFCLIDYCKEKKNNPTRDIHLIENDMRLQEQFWDQFITISPESYIAYGDNFNFATNNIALYEKALRWAYKTYSFKISED